MSARILARVPAMSLVVLLALPGLALAAPPAPAAAADPVPLQLRLVSGELARSCADPAVLRDPQAASPAWYLYCASDTLSQRERDSGGWHVHLIPIYRSTDLLHWDFVADAFSERPPGLAAPDAALTGPEPAYRDGRYYLYFTVSHVTDEYSPVRGCARVSAIGVATAASPAGPWTAQAQPVAGPRQAGPGCDFRPFVGPRVVSDGGQKELYYGGQDGGIRVQRLRADGMAAEGGARRVGADGRYEGADVVRHEGWWYLFASSGDTVFAGRARVPFGPFLDRLGKDMAAGGGSAVLSLDGKRWRGPAHGTVFQDAGGQWWTIHDAVDPGEPYFSAPDRVARRVALLERIDWVDGWPVAGGARP